MGTYNHYKNMAHRVVLAYGESTDSPYINIHYHDYGVDDSVPKDEVSLGPPSMYNDIDKKDKIKNQEDIRRNQGERPHRDVFENASLPVTVTVLNEGKTNNQNKPNNDTTRPYAINDNKDTIGFNYGEWVDPGSDAAPSQYNNPYL